ncbi:MAG: histidinol dehydrogenase, partial [Anaerolineae bacterium]|nr:histidinol dehydrogenase [Anaerolineae bacterium]
MADNLIRIWTDVEDARRTVLQRRDMMNLDEVPENVMTGIRKVFGEELTPGEAVARILKDVRTRGDDALREWTQRIEGLEIDDFAIPAPALKDAYEKLPADLRDAMEQSAARIRAFHEHQPIESWTTNDMGGTLGQRVTPLERVGVYVPGGTAPLPSSLLMAAIPARVAGVDDLFRVAVEHPVRDSEAGDTDQPRNRTARRGRIHRSTDGRRL